MKIEVWRGLAGLGGDLNMEVLAEAVLTDFGRFGPKSWPKLEPRWAKLVSTTHCKINASYHGKIAKKLKVLCLLNLQI